jgi:hypothetical protein
MAVITAVNATSRLMLSVALAMSPNTMIASTATFTAWYAVAIPIFERPSADALFL